MPERQASPELPRWIRIGAAAAESGTSPRTIRRRIADGSLAAVRFGGTVLIERASFDAAFAPVTAA